MTKKILLKWLEEQKVKALAQVGTQENAAKATLLAEKCKRSKFDEFAAYILPRATEILDRLESWHKENRADVGETYATYGNLYYCLKSLLVSNTPAIEKLRASEIKATQLDRDLEKRFSNIRHEVEKTYDNVALNVNALANAKLGLEYLTSLGFDMSTLVAEQENSVTALAVPINTSFLLITTKEVHDESETV